MNKNAFIYLRGCKHAAFTVFCVENGQKYYYDPQFNVRVPFSSGQQVKRSIIDKFNEVLGVQPSPITFVNVLNNKNQLGEAEVFSSCDPHYSDQLIGGWMKAESNSKTLKRRSPLSISAMTPLHPLLASLPEENISFDRSDRPSVHNVIVRDPSGKALTDEQINNLLEGSNRSLCRKWIQGNTRATGLFVYDVAIDMRRLFCVSTNQREPEITSDMVEKLKNDGWKVVNTVFGECLLMPKDQREKVIPAIADALIDWHITSNQARTFSLMETLAIAISDNANTLAAAIRSKLIDSENESKPKAKPIIDEHAGAATYITLPCASYIVTETESADALEKAKQDLINRMLTFDYENQL